MGLEGGRIWIRKHQKYWVLISNKIYFKHIIIQLDMARTKQTARKSTAQKVPRMQLVAQKIVRKSAPLTTGHVIKEESQPEIDDDEEDLEIGKPKIITDQFSLRFDDQEKCQEKAVQADIHRCEGCEAILTSQSEVLTNDAYKGMKKDKKISDAEKQKFLDKFEQVWICEFCLKHNSIPNGYVLPKEQNPCFLVEKIAKKEVEKVHNEEKVLIFCIDVSGSMDFQVEGKSRLESVQQGIMDEIKRFKFQKQAIKVGIITFGSYVNLIGDGHKFKQTRLDTKLYKNFEELAKQVSKINNFCFPVTTSFKSLKDVVSDLSTYGATALGPALLSAVELASKGGIGSKVILCTDGEANVGIGGSFSDDRFTFYEKMSDYAKEKKVMVNILSLKGDKCNLKELGKLSYATGGMVMKIDPKALGTQFSKIIEEKILGSDCKVKIKLNKRFQVCNGKPGEVSYDLTTVNKDLGNFSDDTQLIFQFIAILEEQAKKNPQIDLDLYKRSKLPMQVQVQYLSRKGNKYMQVITDWRIMVDDENQVLEGAHFGLFAASVLQRASDKIRSGEFKLAESILNGYWSLVKEKFEKQENQEQIQKFNQRIRNLERVLRSKMFKKGGIAMGKGLAGKGLGGKSVSRSRSRDSKKGRGGRGHGRGKAKIEVEQNDDYRMSSDSEEEILFKEARARSRSRSREKKRSKKA